MDVRYGISGTAGRGGERGQDSDGDDGRSPRIGGGDSTLGRRH